MELKDQSRKGLLRRFLALKPYEDRLLTKSAEFWFFAASVLVFIMATAEGLGWGYLGFLFGDGFLRWVGAAFAGLIIFLVVWMIDSSLITMDRAAHEHTVKILGAEAETKEQRQNRLAREAFTLVLRIGLVVGSLTVTAPYLAQVVFHKDIEQVIDKEATRQIDLGRNQLKQSYDLKLAAKDKDIEMDRAALQREVAGKGLSGKYGMGDAAKALSDTIDKLKDERGGIVAERDDALGSYDELAKDWRSNHEGLAARYNVVLPRTSILENRKALEEIRKRPENQSTEFAIKAFLAFIFAGILLLKLFEPRSVHYYLSEVLQEQYDRYRVGTFDEWLPDRERSEKRFTMSPQHFYDFLVRTGIPMARKREADIDAAARRQEAIAARKKEVRSLEAHEKNLAQIKLDCEKLEKRLENAREKLKDAVAVKQELKTAIDAYQADVDKYTNLLSGQQTYKDEASRLAYIRERDEWESSRGKANLCLQAVLSKQPEVEQALTDAANELQRLRNQLNEKYTEEKESGQKISGLRKRLADEPGEYSASDSASGGSQEKTAQAGAQA